MRRSTLITVAAALLFGGTSLATAKSRGAADRHGNRPHPAIEESTSHPTAPNPYYRLSDQYYGQSDPYHGLFNYFLVPPYTPGYNYNYVGPRGSR
jgi:hypothetical protein